METIEFKRKIEEFISDGSGSGSGTGSGYGYGDGTGYGTGSGDGIKSINGHTVYMVDDTPTVFFNIKGNVAKCATLDCKISLLPCFVVKGGGLFAHGSTLHEARAALQAKLLKRKPIEERIADFKAEFESGKKYPTSEFFKWHHILTGSCEFGRREFCRQHNIDLENGQIYRRGVYRDNQERLWWRDNQEVKVTK